MGFEVKGSVISGKLFDKEHNLDRLTPANKARANELLNKANLGQRMSMAELGEAVLLRKAARGSTGPVIKSLGAGFDACSREIERMKDLLK